MPARHTRAINQLRAAIRGKRDAELMRALQQKIETMDMPVLAADNSSRYVAVNRRARELLGYSAAELSGMAVMDLTPMPKSDAARALWEAFIAQGVQQGEYELCRKNGTTVRVRYMAWASIVPGIHVSLLTPVTGAGEPAAAGGA